MQSYNMQMILIYSHSLLSISSLRLCTILYCYFYGLFGNELSTEAVIQHSKQKTPETP